MIIKHRIWRIKLEKYDTYYVLADSFEEAENIIRKWRPNVPITDITLYLDAPVITSNDIL